ncbi:MAG: 50S ribosomal protein L24 [Thermoproteota archaeon]|jgi:large subunit ribosomal protein L24|nr:50S ribosomal protein L24 [Thermoproteota archaeon]
MTAINPKLTHIAKHQRDKMVGAVLDDTLRNQYGRKNIRVIKGDSVRVMRGEYKGVEGKVEKVNTENSTFHIEGIQREKIRGGQVKVPIHSSNVMVVSLNLDDHYRSSKLQGTTKRESAPAPSSDKQQEKEEKKKEEEI